MVNANETASQFTFRAKPQVETIEIHGCNGTMDGQGALSQCFNAT